MKTTFIKTTWHLKQEKLFRLLPEKRKWILAYQNGNFKLTEDSIFDSRGLYVMSLGSRMHHLFPDVNADLPDRSYHRWRRVANLIIIFDIFEKHIVQVFRCFKEANLKLNLQKCKYYCFEVEYLVHSYWHSWMTNAISLQVVNQFLVSDSFGAKHLITKDL